MRFAMSLECSEVEAVETITGNISDRCFTGFAPLRRYRVDMRVVECDASDDHAQLGDADKGVWERRHLLAISHFYSFRHGDVPNFVDGLSSATGCHDLGAFGAPDVLEVSVGGDETAAGPAVNDSPEDASLDLGRSAQT